MTCEISVNDATCVQIGHSRSDITRNLQSLAEREDYLKKRVEMVVEDGCLKTMEISRY